MDTDKIKKTVSEAQILQRKMAGKASAEARRLKKIATDASPNQNDDIRVPNSHIVSLKQELSELKNEIKRNNNESRNEIKSEKVEHKNNFDYKEFLKPVCLMAFSQFVLHGKTIPYLINKGKDFFLKKQENVQETLEDYLR